MFVVIITKQKWLQSTTDESLYSKIKQNTILLSGISNFFMLSFRATWINYPLKRLNLSMLLKLTVTRLWHCMMLRRDTGWNAKVLGSRPGGEGYGGVKTRKGKEVLRASTVRLCPASWQPVWKASVLRGGCNGRSWSFSEAPRSWLHDCSLVACCPPKNMTNIYGWLDKLSEITTKCLHYFQKT